MSKQVEKRPEGKKNPTHILLFLFALLLPSTMWVLLGWTSSFLPLLVFVFISKYGWSYTNRHILIAILIAAPSSYFLQNLELTLFCIALLPAGYAVAYSARSGEEPWKAGLKGWLTLCISIILYFNILLFNSDISFFQAISQAMNSGIDEALRQYRDTDSLSPENQVVLEETLNQIKVIAPLVLPSILGSILALLSWMTVVLGNTILPKINCSQPWVDYRLWRLPEKLVWILIASGITALLPTGILRVVGINCLIVTVTLYSFQGLAVIVYLLNKWNVPRFVRTFLYVMLIVQSFGTILLITVGVADVWFDIRRRFAVGPDNNNDTE
ncbi:MAG: DUF2232 domain-containing protein [Desulfopila sp.]|nr:DUF2232 domain-containing protein [Desulfopila sp.]